MDRVGYAAAYGRGARLSHSTAVDLGVEFARANDYSHRWGEILYDYLHGDQRLPLDKLVTFSAEYMTWSRTSVPDLTAHLEPLTTQDDPDLATFSRAMQALNFHRMNTTVQDFWAQLLHRPRIHGISRDSARYRLAATGVTLFRSRQQLVDLDAFFDPDLADFRSWLTGSLTELDMYVALLELTLHDPTICVLPAPEQFQVVAGPANVNFIVISISTGRVIGVQAITSGAWRVTSRYDKDRVLVLSGAEHLGDQAAQRTDPRRSERRVVAWPGLVSAHYVLATKLSKQTDEYVPRRELVQHKLQARGVALDGIRSDNPRAFATVRRLVLERLE